MSIRFLIPPTLGTVKAAARAGLMEQAMTRLLETEVSVTVADSYGDIEKRFLANETDIAWAPPSVCARLTHRAAGVFKTVRRGRSSYRAAIVVRAHESTDLAQLQGARAVWTDPASTGGYLLADAWFRNSGHDPDRLFSTQAFLGSYDACLRALLDRQADVTSIYCNGENLSDARASCEQQVGFEAEYLQAIAVTGEVGSDAVLISSELDAKTRAIIAGALEALAEPRGTPLVLTLLDAEALRPAGVGAYAGLATGPQRS